jgi:hypothetical protein
MPLSPQGLLGQNLCFISECKDLGRHAPVCFVAGRQTTQSGMTDLTLYWSVPSP